MSSPQVIGDAIAATIVAGIPGVISSTDPSKIMDPPAVIVEPATADFMSSYGQGTDVWMYNVFVLCSRRDENEGIRELNALIAGSGPTSIRQLLLQNGIGLADTTAYVAGMKGYGGHFKSGGVPMTGAILVVKAITDGKT